MEIEQRTCRACGARYALDLDVCPRCRVASKGDVNRPAILAYGVFLLMMLVLGWIAIHWLTRGS